MRSQREALEGLKSSDSRDLAHVVRVWWSLERRGEGSVRLTWRKSMSFGVSSICRKKEASASVLLGKKKIVIGRL